MLDNLCLDPIDDEPGGTGARCVGPVSFHAHSPHHGI